MLIKALDRLFEAYWVEHKKTHEKEGLKEVLDEVLGKEESEKGVYSRFPCSFYLCGLGVLWLRFRWKIGTGQSLIQPWK